MRLAIPTALCAALSLAACEPDFPPYNELEGLRVLAVRAEPPDLTVGKSARLDALIYHPEGQTPELSWSMCPWPSDPNDGFTCVVSQGLFDRAWREAKLKGATPSLALGTASTAELSFPGSAQDARNLCEALTRLLGSAATLPPDCSTRFPWTVRLSTRLGAASIDTVKDVDLLIDPAMAENHNPTLTELRSEGAQSMVLDPTVESELRSGEDHGLRVGAAAGAVESYVPVPALGEPPQPARNESLTFTWFVDQGSTDRIRSTYKDGVESLSEATHNVWQAPDTPSHARLFVVVRDHRGGVGFLERTVRLVE